LRESARGGSDLYVAVTRATQRLGVIALDELPEVLRRLATP
jgi:ATP-dependent exoDNAse (exonuclease V) alpha subunit